MRHDRSIIPGVILVVLGVGFLGEVNHWWVLDWRVLVAIWPAYLILIGIRLLLPKGPSTDWLFAAILVVGSATVLAVPTSTVDQFTGQSRFENRTTTLEQTGAADVANLTFKISAGATKLRLTSLPDSDARLYTATSHGTTLEQTYHRTNNTATAEVNQSSQWSSLTSTLDVALSRHPAINLSVDAGASKSDIDLSNATINALSIDGGASTVTVKLGTRADQQILNVDGGASTLTINVPRVAALKIINNSNLTSTNFGELGLTNNDNTYVSSNFDGTKPQITLNFDGGASTIHIGRY